MIELNNQHPTHTPFQNEVEEAYNKLGRCLHKNISKTQFGFIPTCTSAEALTYLQTVINRARRTGEPISNSCFGCKSCF